jgi:hypothetical protein
LNDWTETSWTTRCAPPPPPALLPIETTAPATPLPCPRRSLTDDQSGSALVDRCEA